MDPDPAPEPTPDPAPCSVTLRMHKVIFFLQICSYNLPTGTLSVLKVYFAKILC
jgi:hypothetical protein